MLCVCVCVLLELPNWLTDCHEIWRESYTDGKHPQRRAFQFYTIKSGNMAECELVIRKRHKRHLYSGSKHGVRR